MDAAANNGSWNSQMRMLLEGKDQLIMLDFKAVLSTVIASLGIKTPAVFKEHCCSEKGVKFSVILDLSILNKSNSSVFVGLPFQSSKDAEADAVCTALSYLEDNRMVKVLDLSSRVSMSTTLFKAMTDAAQASESVQEVLHKFEKNLDQCKDLAKQVPAHCEVYDGLREFLCNVVSEFSTEASNLRLKITTLQLERRNMHEAQIAKRRAALGKDFPKKVILSSKYIFDYLLSYLGRDNAKYINEPDGNGMVDASVTFLMPYSKKRKFGGNIQIRGKGNSSQNAEEDAAFQALLFFEQQFGITIVDLNRLDRVVAENEHTKINKILELILQVATLSDQMWDKFSGVLASKIEDYTSHSSSLLNHEPDGLPVEYKFCVDALMSIEDQYVHSVESRWKMADKMDDITGKLQSLKF